MNTIERKIEDDFAKNHFRKIMEKAGSSVDSLGLSDAALREVALTNEIRTLGTYRITYLFLQAYHQAIAKHLAKNGVELPDFDELEW